MALITANSSVFYGFMVFQDIIELICAEAGDSATCDIEIAGAPLYDRHGEALSLEGFSFVGGSDYAVFRLVATLSTRHTGGNDEVCVVLGREALFDACYHPLATPIDPFELTRKDVTQQRLIDAPAPFVLTFPADALPLIAWVIYTLFVDYHVNLECLEHDFEV